MEIVIKNKKINLKSECFYGFYNFNNIDSIFKDNDQIYNINNYFYTTTVLKEIHYFNSKINRKSIIEIIEKFDLEESFLKRKINTLSNSEQIFLSFILFFVNNKKVLIINNLFNNLDKNNQNIIKNVLSVEKDIIIVFNINDINILYTLTDNIIINTKRSIISGNTKEILQDVELLEKNKVEIPDLVKITYLAKKEKNIKLFYHTDVRDIIKDIYKHV